jgi:hypothetical protein
MMLEPVFEQSAPWSMQLTQAASKRRSSGDTHQPPPKPPGAANPRPQTHITYLHL